MNANDLTSGNFRGGISYSFGIDKDKTVAALRELADNIENGGFAIQRATIVEKVDIEDFAMKTVVITFAPTRDPKKVAENRAKESEVKKLYSAESQFPVAAVRTEEK